MAIRRRIIKGYTVVLGVALAGIIGGLAVGDAYERHAQELRREATTERKLFNELQVSILRNRLANQLSPYLSKPAEFEQASQAFFNRLDEIELILEAHHQLHNDIGSSEHSHHEDTQSQMSAEQEEHHHHEEMTSEHQPSSIREHMPSILNLPSQSFVADIDSLHESMEKFEAILATFRQKVRVFVDEIIAAPPTTDEELAIAQTKLLELARSEEFSNFVNYPEELMLFLDEVTRREQLAEDNLRRAERIRVLIILGSLCLSMLLAAIVAVITSRAIAKPISEIAEFSHRVTKAEDFNQSLDVQGDDEIETLSSSLNQLIRQVYLLLNTIGRKNEELEQAFEQLQQQQIQMVQTEKMSSLGALVAGIAHEINNPVNFIHGNIHHSRIYLEDLLRLLKLYQEHYPTPNQEIEDEVEAIDLNFLITDFPKILNSMTLGTQRIRDIVLSLRTFSRTDEAEFKAVNIHEGIDSTLVILNHRLKEESGRPAIQIIKNYGELPLIECFPGQLNQVFINILNNAIDALEESSFNLSTAELTASPNQITISTGIIAPNKIELRFKDNGQGMTDDIQEKIFNPFFTTKLIGEGTGMGMSISYQIITENHAGEIFVNSTAKVGSELIIRIPIRHTPVSKQSEQEQYLASS
ncbi:integral membrane sensor signal transduction histidine kinase [[Leptolyngbya] sp. PCC 7376]|uniref:sensor histidine kinase n=1 Tax=[Leptolyngbya] sp. PCC 7376 TaxID=111781 RepID=UPI00029F2A16|nr:ATP-binding protein [[Leptolyngbya] sp. PCC 7376]AFY39187.1 integral membrane sensor signal transduction histidine kinase [[Leptolyngbya] sp. PCC 7376]